MKQLIQNYMKLSPSDYRRTHLYCLLAFRIITYIVIANLITYYLTNANCSSLRQTDILGICKITLTKACKTFVLIEEFA